MRINVKEFMDIAGWPPESESMAAISLGAHFEVFVHEKSLEEAKKQLLRAQQGYEWFQAQREVAEVKRLLSFSNEPEGAFWKEEDRKYRMILWYAENMVKVVEDGDFEFPEHLPIDRKKTGSYYTPKSLIDVLLDSALEPVIKQAIDGASERK